MARRVSGEVQWHHREAGSTQRRRRWPTTVVQAATDATWRREASAACAVYRPGRTVNVHGRKERVTHATMPGPGEW